MQPGLADRWRPSRAIFVAHRSRMAMARMHCCHQQLSQPCPTLTWIRPVVPCCKQSRSQHRPHWTCRATSHYDLLGVAEDATQEQVKRAFRRAARTLHPDVNNSPEAATQFMTLLKAYQTLTEASARSAYDAEIGTSDARAKDPRFARFERWRRQVVPVVEAQLDDWNIEVDQMIAGWHANLQSYDTACQAALSEAQALLDHLSAVNSLTAINSTSSISEGPASAAVHALQLQYTAAIQSQVLQHVMQSAVDAVNILQIAVRGNPMQQYAEKRFEQLCVMLPAYPEIVWEQEWYNTSDGWLDRADELLAQWRSAAQQHALLLNHLLSRYEEMMSGRSRAVVSTQWPATQPV